MRRATPLEQVQTVPIMLHAQGQVGCLVECSHRKGTERGLLPAFSILFNYGIYSLHIFISQDNTFAEINEIWLAFEPSYSILFHRYTSGK